LPDPDERNERDRGRCYGGGYFSSGRFVITFTNEATGKSVVLFAAGGARKDLLSTTATARSR